MKLASKVETFKIKHKKTFKDSSLVERSRENFWKFLASTK